MYPILESKPYGGMILLTCKNHPHLRWRTKNISPLGCRNIFFANWVRQEDGSLVFTDDKECNCPGSDLIVVEEQ